MAGTELQCEASRIMDALRINALFHKKVQPTLRQYVTDKSFPLDERFLVWEAYCDKEHRDCAPARGEFGIVGNLVCDCIPYDYERYRTYGWEDFIEYAEDDEVGMTVEQFKEILIETNFGSFVMDW